MRKKKTLIYTALMPEAKPIIGYLKLKRVDSNIFDNDEILLLVGGIGSKITIDILNEIFKKYCFSKVINVGICGCVDKNIDVGELFCTNQKLPFIPKLDISSFDKPITSSENIKTTLVDMEAEAFLKVTSLHVEKSKIFIFKIVSDYLNATIPTKSFVNSLIQKNIKKIVQYV